MEPALELKRLRIELQRAAGPRRLELQLASAAVQERELEDVAGAVQTLRQVVAESGPGGAGYGALAAILVRTGAYGELIDLMEARATALGETRAAQDVLREALGTCDAHPDVGSTAQRERLAKQLLALSPEDEAVRRRLYQLYRSTGRHAELATLLEAVHKGADAPAWVEDELVRLYDRSLTRPADAERLLRARLARTPEDGEAMLALASSRLRNSDLDGYIKLREEHARLWPANLGALALCHLAETCDEVGAAPERIIGYYREARALWPQNRQALDGMKALGRRTRGWRASR
jgi:thioredoxin-like negative regulator of GroEL